MNLLRLLIFLSLVNVALADEFTGRFPAGSITSLAQADQAIAAATAQRTQVENTYQQKIKACNQKFIVNSCVNAATAERRSALAQVDAVMVEAQGFKRRYNAAQRAQADQQREQERLEQEPQAAAERAKRAQAYEQKQHEHAQKTAEKNSSARSTQSTTKSPKTVVDDSAQRSKNAAQYAQKVKDAEMRQAKIAKKRAEKEAEREKKRLEEQQQRN